MWMADANSKMAVIRDFRMWNTKIIPHKVNISVIGLLEIFSFKLPDDVSNIFN